MNNQYKIDSIYYVKTAGISEALNIIKQNLEEHIPINDQSSSPIKKEIFGTNNMIKKKNSLYFI